MPHSTWRNELGLQDLHTTPENNENMQKLIRPSGVANNMELFKGFKQITLCLKNVVKLLH